jgi:NAD(P) transhydrogenase subunit alpha
VLVSLLAPALDPGLVERLAARGVTALAMDAVPRISRAQSLDVLSSMANIGGYRAVLEAAHEFGSFFTGQVTAAGKVPPGEGARGGGRGSPGWRRSARPARSGRWSGRSTPAPRSGSRWSRWGRSSSGSDVEETGPSADGYARQTSADFDAKAAQLYAEQAPDVDILITTALIPGRPAPLLFTEAMVASMKPGSVVVDMAAANGGNVAGSVAGQKVVTEGGVTILGYTDLPGRLPTQASQLFGTNLVNLLKLLTPGRDGELVLDLDDVVQRGMTVARGGEVLWPPPPVTVSAAPARPGASRTVAAPAAPAPAPGTRWSSRLRAGAAAAGALLFVLVAAVSPEPLLAHVLVFLLSVVIGFYVIGNVHHALHTPLMSVTNAISGIIVVGALLQVGQGSPAVSVLAFVAILVASINIFGGFRVTARMLHMFRRHEDVSR